MSRTETKICNRNIIQVVAPGLIALGCLVGTAYAHQVSLDGDIEVGDGYVSTGDGFAVRSGDGDCLLGSDYSEDDNGLDACRGIEEKVAEPTPEPTPEPTKSRVVSSVEISGEALFALNSDQLSAEGIAALQDVIRQVTEYQGVTEIEIIGHTDSSGAADYNQDLSERRAETVKDALGKSYPDVNIVELAESAPDITLMAAGMGESQPIAENSTKDGRAKNRRVEILIKAKDVKFE